MLVALRSTNRLVNIEDQESLNMKNFIFKSSNTSDLLKIFTQLEMLLNEQRAQRADLVTVKKRLNMLLLESKSEPSAEDLGYSNTEHGE